MTYLNLYIIVSALLIVVGFIIYFSNKKKKVSSLATERQQTVNVINEIHSAFSVKFGPTKIDLLALDNLLNKLSDYSECVSKYYNDEIKLCHDEVYEYLKLKLKESLAQNNRSTELLFQAIKSLEKHSLSLINVYSIFEEVLSKKDNIEIALMYVHLIKNKKDKISYYDKDRILVDFLLKQRTPEEVRYFFSIVEKSINNEIEIIPLRNFLNLDKKTLFSDVAINIL